MLGSLIGGNLRAVCPCALLCVLALPNFSGHFPALGASNALAPIWATAADAGRNNLMKCNPFRNVRCAAGAKYEIELLEPRRLFAASSFDPAPPLDSEAMVYAGANAATNATNHKLGPSVNAGADATTSVSNSLQLTGEVLFKRVSNISIQWSKVSGPGNAIFGSSSAISTSVQFDQAGSYELQLSATNRGITVSDRLFVTVTASNDLEYAPTVYAGADATTSVSNSLQLNGQVLVNRESNLSMQWSKVSGPGNAVLGSPSAIGTSVQFDQAGSYELQLSATNRGITVSDRLFVTVTASNIINIDQAWLNAQGDGPFYLDQQGKTYVLQTDVTTAGTAFAIIASNVTLDLNGHTITYDNATPITIPNGSFEVGAGAVADGWNFAGAPNATRHQGVWLHNEVYDGDHSLKFSLPGGDQFVTSTKTITLEANTTYSLSAMFEYGGQGDASNPGVKGFVRLVGDGLPTREVSWNSTNWRGIQLREGTFTTGNSTETYSIQVGVEGGATLDSATTKPFYIDDVKIQRTRAYGVTTSTKSWSPADYPDIIRWGTGTNAMIKNGAIVQGADGATWGHGVFVHTTGGVTIQDLNVTVHGANSSAINGKDQGAFTSIVRDNTLTSNVKTISSRDNFDGAVISRLQGDIHGNTLTNGIHSGIVAANGTATARVASNIYGNTVQLSSKYTNGFAIVAGWGSQIHDNVVNCGAGAFAARGILVSSGDPVGATTRVYGNSIHVQQLIANQEYQGAVLGGAYGIQLENAKNVEVYDNSVTAYGNDAPAYAFRMNSDEGTSAAVSVHDNTFRAVAGRSHAAAVKFTRIDEGSIQFVDNELITNDGVVGTTDNSFVILLRSTITVIAPISDPYPIESDYASVAGLHTRITLLDPTFTDASSRAYLESATTRIASRFGGAIDDKIAFDLRWTTAFLVKNVGGAALPNVAVTITDKTGAVTTSGTTDANGLLTAALTQFSTQGSAKTTFKPFMVTATVGGVPTQQQFDADRVQTIEVILATEAASNGLLMPSLEGIPILIANETDVPKIASMSDVLKHSKLTLPKPLRSDSTTIARRNETVIVSSEFGYSGDDHSVVPSKNSKVQLMLNEDSSYLQSLDEYFNEFIVSDLLFAM
jgi:hypothetical protein